MCVSVHDGDLRNKTNGFEFNIFIVISVKLHGGACITPPIELIYLYTLRFLFYLNTKQIKVVANSAYKLSM